MERYPLENYPDPGAALADVFADHTFTCQEKFTSDALARHEAPVYSYHFDYADADFMLPELRELGAFHSAELQFIFGDSFGWFESSFSGKELELSHMLMDYWTQFATSVDPNGKESLPEWPLYNENRERLTLGMDPKVINGKDTDELCAFWQMVSSRDFVTK
jgi:para-nitrobenzyl esterase